MNAFSIVITVIAALFFVGSGVLLPLFELAEQLPGRRKVRGPTPTPQSSLTTPGGSDGVSGVGQGAPTGSGSASGVGHGAPVGPGAPTGSASVGGQGASVGSGSASGAGHGERMAA